MDSFVLYKHAKSARTRNYPTLVSKALISVEHAPSGLCQNAGCTAECEFLRVWLCPDRQGRVTVANLNGVRYCANHAHSYAEQTGMPLLASALALKNYHEQIIELEKVADLGSHLPYHPAVGVKIVAKLGTIERRTDGSFVCHLNDGSSVSACCHAVAAQLVGLSGKMPSCKVENCKKASP